MSMVPTQLFSSFFLSAGRIHFIILNQAAGWSKFDCRPDLACGPDFGHACSEITLVFYLWKDSDLVSYVWNYENLVCYAWKDLQLVCYD